MIKKSDKDKFTPESGVLLYHNSKENVYGLCPFP